MTDDVAVIADLEDRRYEAMVRGDGTMLGLMCDAELIYTHSDGSSDTRDSYLQRIRDGYFDYGPLEWSMDRTVIAGDCAVVLGWMGGDVIIDGVVRHLNSATLVVWVRRVDGWRFLAFQPTPLPVS